MIEMLSKDVNKEGRGWAEDKKEGENEVSN